MDTESYGRYTVREAAIRLGISEAAVRQRIRRHTLVAERSDGIVYVVLSDSTASYTPDSTPFETVDATPDSTAITTATRQLEAIRDEWLAPLVAQISETREHLGRVTAERDQARQSAEAAIAARDQLQEERDELIAVRETLRVRLSVLEAQSVASPQREPDAPQTATARAWWAFWKR